MFNPVSTYRIQFHKGFTFSNFEKVIPYLEELGIKTIYASPVFESVPGSTHGYDGVNPLTINPEIGSIEELRTISKTLKQKGISWIQDIVPNHMAFHPDNPWLMDFLEKGPDSPYKTYFDQSLSDDLFNGPIMVPFLGSDLDEVIANGELVIEKYGDNLFFNYSGSKWPLKAGSYPDIELKKVNSDKELLKQIAEAQHYRLCSWKETDAKINFRRFFTVNGLICINIQDQKVFDHFHQLINTLLKEEIFQGLRIDHIDGLFDPTKYLEQLRNLCGDDTYIIVEKILETGEEMPGWPVQGNTGYDFLGQLNNLLTNRKSENIFNDFYARLTKNSTPVEQQIRQKKAYILNKQMGGELDNLTRLFLSYSLIGQDQLKEIARDDVKKVIAQFLIHCPVYRYYGNESPLCKPDKNAVKGIVHFVKKSYPELEHTADLFEEAILQESEKALLFYQRCMQFTGPLMAKGVEDTLMYTFNRFIGHNEVGDAPDAFGISVSKFHHLMTDRQKNWPLSMNGTSTHDTKRGEDARARLNVLTDIPQEWIEIVESWRLISKSQIKKNGPDANDEYFFYETLLGTYPMPGKDEDNYPERIDQYLEKTLREAKLHSGWAEPNEGYEQSVKDFARSLLDKNGTFWKSFAPFHEMVSSFGVINSLSQTLLKFTSPGMPDTYQGCELWDLSMVDPDNRRPVDYAARAKLLKGLDKIDLKQLWSNKFGGQIKLWLTRILLRERKENPLLFTEGVYIPLQVEGKYKHHIMAFARSHKRTCYLSVIPFNITSLQEDPNAIDWADTAILLDKNMPGTYKNLLSGRSGKAVANIAIKELFTDIPLAFLKLQQQESGRSSGVLMHITSLPSPFAIGDFGPSAMAFADKLYRAGQKYWQLLPLSPVDAANQYSPYSSWSGMAGNTVLISLELLVTDALLTNEDLEKYREPENDKADLKIAEWLKNILFDTAWQNYKDGTAPWLKQPFDDFGEKETGWLHDHALYSVLKTHHNGASWFTWDDALKFRDKKTLNKFAEDHKDEIAKAKWLQFIFARQWQKLKAYCNGLNIQIIGDLPFYVSYDSVDVWANPEIFSLNKNAEMEFIAGVPPDYFNANGQLWGMPTFKWEKLQQTGYDWWLKRIKKNLELFDLLRLDHFRAFSSYWAVPAGEETAINGKWEPALGLELFEILQKELGEMPLIAEDLGDIDEAVYQLRDKFNLPGMKVLQFAFGDDIALSPHIPHNYQVNEIVYTGTHDNNTLLGWFNTEAEKANRKNIKKYTNSKVKSDNVNKILIQTAMVSVAKTAIIPIQDLLGLDENSRMNTPAGDGENWLWRLTPHQLKHFPAKQLKKWTVKYNRD